MEHFSTRDLVVEVVHKLFVYTDNRQWGRLLAEVFCGEVQFDMSSLGGAARRMAAKDICHEWELGFEGLDAINHLCGNHLVSINGPEATVFAYATATHYKKSATRGNTREFVGTYDLHLVRTAVGWRIDGFTHHLKYMTGNIDFK
ncbi:nuclear transport factor 2 family protein [Flaviaesturariibacter amylovorans]|uniref:SnoaL-like domain-containing protein n=1 Tax=Flaviaesturariibacter amylovorans TaxID=1084520 RepID=A0ABP8GLK2_9BACT